MKFTFSSNFKSELQYYFRYLHSAQSSPGVGGTLTMVTTIRPGDAAATPLSGEQCGL